MFTFVATLTQTCHSGRKEAKILIYNYGTIGLPTPNLFRCVVYVAPVGSKHESESLFQNLVADIAEVQTLGGIVLLGGDFITRIATLPNTIDTNDLCKLLHAPKLAETEQLSDVARVRLLKK